MEYAGTNVLTRGGLSPLRSAPAAAVAPTDQSDRTRAEGAARLEARGAETHTTNITVVDADENACVFTTSLGLGSGDFLPGLDLHLNSMLGEVDLVVGELVPGERMGSMMSPTLVFDAEGLVLGVGAAGGTRLPTALTLVLAGILDEGLEPQPPSTGRASTRRVTINARPEWTLRRSTPSRPPAARPALARLAPLLRRCEHRRPQRAGADPRRSGAVVMV